MPWRLHLRTAGFGLLLAVLLVLPTILGFRIAAAGQTEAPDPDQVTSVALPDIATASSGSTDQELSERPLGDVSGSSEDALTPAAASATAFSRLTFIDADEERFTFDDGVPFPLTSDLDIVVSLDPFPPTKFDIGVSLELLKDGTPVTGATFDTIWDMVFMYHGPFETPMVEDPAGIYTADYDFFMFGPWRFDTVVDAPGIDPIPFGIEIYVWPN